MRYETSSGGFYELNPFPGCNQIVVSNHSFVPKQARGKGIGSRDHSDRLERIESLGYDYAICTVKENNIPQIKILEKNCWKHLDTFTNRETENTVRIYGRTVESETTNP